MNALIDDAEVACFEERDRPRNLADAEATSTTDLVGRFERTAKT